MSEPEPPPRYRFGDFTLSTRQRALRRGHEPVPLIPKYFDLLRLLLERRDDALDRREMFDRVWPDVVVSESALTQAIRTLRRALGDDPRTPRYIRTVSRHGYQFVFRPVIVERDGAPAPPPDAFGREARGASTARSDEYDRLIARLLDAGTQPLADEERREAAERLHELGTPEALARLAGSPGHARALAILRDARWDVPAAGAVPLLRTPGGFGAVAALIALRLRRAARAAANRLGLASAGCALAGAAAGMIGGGALVLMPGSPATMSAVVALATIGATAGALGGAAVGAGLSAGEALARSQRRLAVALCGAAAGLTAGAFLRLILVSTFDTVVGRPPAGLGGPIEGGIVGLAAGIGFAAFTQTPPGGGMATPRGAARVRAVAGTALCCALAAAALAAAGGSTVSVTLDVAADAYAGSQLGLAPLARVLGEGDLRPLTRALASGFEGLLFGLGLASGLTHRPSPPRSS